MRLLSFVWTLLGLWTVPNETANSHLPLRGRSLFLGHGGGSWPHIFLNKVSLNSNSSSLRCHLGALGSAPCGPFIPAQGPQEEPYREGLDPPHYPHPQLAYVLILSFCLAQGKELHTNACPLELLRQGLSLSPKDQFGIPMGRWHGEYHMPRPLQSMVAQRCRIFLPVLEQRCWALGK